MPLTEEKIQQIPLDDLIPSPGNRRIGGFDPDKLQQLADSIQAVGVQQPIIIRSNGRSKFEIVAGERRWKAARIAGLLDIPAVIRDLDDVTVIKIQTIENLQREDIHPLDEADGYSRLIEQAGYDVEHLAQEVGRSASYVYQRLKLRDLVPEAREMLVDSMIAAGHAILIARLPAGQQKELMASWLFRRGEDVSVRALDDWIHQHILLDLNKAAFKKDDPDLDVEAGPCTICPKRTGYQPALFADVCNGGKRDYCTDPPCFDRKLKAIVDRHRAELKEAKEKHLLVIDGYIGDYEEKRRLMKTEGVLEEYGWEECKKKDEGAVRCLVVAGKSPGRLTWGRDRKHNRYGGYDSTEAERKAAQKEKRELKMKRVTRRRIWDAVIQELDNRAVYEDLPVDLVRIIASNHWKRTWSNTQKIYCQTMEWERPPKTQHEYGYPSENMGLSRIATMDVPALFRFLLTISLVQELEGPEWQEPECKKLKAVAALYHVDVGHIEKEVREEEKAKEKAKAARATRSKKKKKQPAATSDGAQK